MRHWRIGLLRFHASGSVAGSARDCAWSGTLALRARARPIGLRSLARLSARCSLLPPLRGSRSASPRRLPPPEGCSISATIALQ